MIPSHCPKCGQSTSKTQAPEKSISDNAKRSIARYCDQLAKGFKPDTWGRVAFEGDPNNGSWISEILVAGEHSEGRRSFLVSVSGSSDEAVIGIDEFIRRWRN